MPAPADITFTQEDTMITIQETISLPQTYPLSRLGKPENLLFFDIETTGFSADSSQLYLIGCTYYREQEWHLIQWFADSPGSEIELLHAFFKLLSEFKTVVHFNGDGFDIPYLQKRCAKFHLTYDFSKVSSIDIYKKFRPYKKLLGLANTKQKSVETFLGVSREDMFSGGELIVVYYDYLCTKNEQALRLLLLHNADDLKGMPSILPALYYPDFLESSFCLHTQKQQTEADGSHTLTVQLKSDFSIPVAFDAVSPFGQLQAKANLLTLRIPLFSETLKYFYSDYKNYYYLPAEDRAIHKSVGEFVDKSARKQATAQTCYLKTSGLFFKQPAPIFEPSFGRDRKTASQYVKYCDTLFDNSKTCSQFAHCILEEAVSANPHR